MVFAKRTVRHAMREKRLTPAAKRWSVAFAVAGVAAVLAVWGWHPEGDAVPAASEEPKEHRAEAAAPVDRRAPAKAAAEAQPANALDFAALLLLCDEFYHPVPDRDRRERTNEHWPNASLASEDCRAALEAWFPATPAVAPIVPVAEPTTWGEVFADVPQRLERVLAALADSSCQVPDGEIRTDWAERCAARDMALLTMWKNACGQADGGIHPLLDSDDAGFRWPEYQWQFDWYAYADSAAKLSAGRHWASVNFNRPGHVEAALDERLVDLEEHARQRRRLDEVYLRSGWVRSKCEADRPTLRWMAARPEMFAGLMGRAAALGDEVALADRPLDRGRALTLEKSDPLLAWLHLAARDTEAVQGEEYELWSRAQREVEDRPPNFKARRRLLELAGVECGEPCTREKLRALEIESRKQTAALNRQTRLDCVERGDCDLRNTLKALRKPLYEALYEALLAPERQQAEWQRALPYRKRAESARMKYTLAMEALAKATGREVDVEALRQHVADASLPWYLDDGEVQLARVEAERLVSEALARQASANGANGANGAERMP